MSVLKARRTTSKAEYVNTANQIYVETLNFLTRMSARYSRLLAEPVAKLAGEVVDHAEKANSIFPSDTQRIELRKAPLLEARASLKALDVRLTHCYLVMMQNPEGCFTTTKGRDVPAGEATQKLDRMAASRGKGLHWHFRRVTQQLAWHYRRYGREGGIFLLDLKSFFPNANRDIIYRRHQQVMFDPQIRAVADAIIDYAPYGNAPGRGMPLGVEPSQQEMVSLPSAIDNYIKCQLGLHCAGHYMDDYYVIYHDIEELKQIARDIVKKFESFGIRVNKKKCKIIPLTKPFRFCKARFTLTETGAIKINGSRDGVKRARRKLKMFHREYLAGRKTLFEIDQYMECQTAYYRHFDDHGRLLRLRRLHYAMFNRYREQEQLKKSA